MKFHVPLRKRQSSPVVGLILTAGGMLGATAPAAFGQRAMGIDVSQFQSSINWSQVKNAGMNFAIIRASHGSLLDPLMSTNVNAAKNQGLVCGVYHYAVPVYDAPYNLQGEDPQTQATRFVNYAQNYIAVGYLRPVIDVELGGGQTPVGAITLTAWVNAFNATVKAATGVDCMIYANSNYCRNYLGSSLNVLPLWLADWCGNNECDACGDLNTAQPEHSYGLWSNWTFWQYCSTGSVPGIVGNVDRDVFNGTVAQLQNYVISNTNAAPVISNVQASNIGSTTATITWTTDKTSTSQVQYGLTTSYGNSTPLDSTPVTSHFMNLSGLSPNTLYHYRAISTNAFGTTNSSDFSFTTNGPPAISNVQAINISASQATITWTTNVASTSQVNYGTTPSYGSQTPWDSTPVLSHSVVLSGLTQNTVYHYQAASSNEYGVSLSTNFIFTTTGVPAISNISVANLGSSTATITWTTSVPSDSQVEYGPTTSYGSSSPLNSTYVTSHSVTLSGLNAVTLYHYRVRSANSFGPAYSGDATFTTIAYVADLIVDNSDPGWANTSPGGAAWTSGASGSVPKVGSTYLFSAGTGNASEGSITRRCTWTPTVSVAGFYDVYAFYQTGSNRNTAAPYKIFYNGGNVTSIQNQYSTSLNGGDWYLLQSNLPFAAGSAGYVQLANNSTDTNYVSADAVKLVYKGPTAGPPTITQNPQQQFVCPDDVVLFTITASGQGTLLYRWQKDGVDIFDGGHYIGAATSSLGIIPVGVEDAGSYRCVVTSGGGSATSNSALLVVQQGTVISKQPSPLQVCSGTDAYFQVLVSGDGTVTYQWQRNGSNVSGEGSTSNTLWLRGISSLDVGTYRCLINAGCGTVTSSEVTLSLGNQSSADLNNDCCVDYTDLDSFLTCLSGPGIPHNGTTICQKADSNDDGSVDMSDFSTMQRCFSGTYIPADPNCDN